MPCAHANSAGRKGVGLCRADKTFFPLGRCFRESLFACCPESIECFHRRLIVPLTNKRMVIGKRFPPVSHRKVWFDFLCEFEFTLGLDKTKTVEIADAEFEMFLCLWRARCREIESANRVMLCRPGSRAQDYKARLP